MVWSNRSRSTLNGMALVHTWHFNRDGDAPWKKSSRWLALTPLWSQALLSCRKPSNSPLSTRLEIQNRVYEIHWHVRLVSFILSRMWQWWFVSFLVRDSRLRHHGSVDATLWRQDIWFSPRHSISICALSGAAKNQVKHWTWQWIPNQFLTCRIDRQQMFFFSVDIKFRETVWVFLNKPYSFEGMQMAIHDTVLTFMSKISLSATSHLFNMLDFRKPSDAGFTATLSSGEHAITRRALPLDNSTGPLVTLEC